MDRRKQELTRAALTRRRHRIAIFAAAVLSLFSGGGAAADQSTVNVVARDAVVTTSVASATAKTVEVHDIRSRDERTRLLVETVEAPVAVAVLFAGGKGAMDLSASGEIGWGKGNFLIRSRPLLLKNRIATAIFDAPTDKHSDLRYGFRGSAEHAADIGAAIAHLRAVFKLPVWLVGTSRGTNSVGNAAVRLGTGGPDGIVLTASMLAWNEKGDNLLDFDLDRITVPVLIAHHEDDECGVTPPDKVGDLASELSNARIVRTVLYRGGTAAGNPCQAFHHHGFNGIEEQVIGDIAAWIKAPAR